MGEEELLQRKADLNREILTMEWDKKRSQLNFGKNQRLKECKEELENVKKEISMRHSQEKEAQ